MCEREHEDDHHSRAQGVGYLEQIRVVGLISHTKCWVPTLEPELQVCQHICPAGRAAEGEHYALCAPRQQCLGVLSLLPQHLEAVQLVQLRAGIIQAIRSILSVRWACTDTLPTTAVDAIAQVPSWQSRW